MKNSQKIKSTKSKRRIIGFTSVNSPSHGDNQTSFLDSKVNQTHINDPNDFNFSNLRSPQEHGKYHLSSHARNNTLSQVMSSSHFRPSGSTLRQDMHHQPDSEEQPASYYHQLYMNLINNSGSGQQQNSGSMKLNWLRQESEKIKRKANQLSRTVLGGRRVMQEAGLEEVVMGQGAQRQTVVEERTNP